MLFFLPELQDNSDYKITVPNDEVQLLEEMCCGQTAETGCCEEFCDLAKLVMEDEGLQYPFTAYFVNTNTLVSLYYALIYPFFMYSLIAWGNTYESNVLSA